MTQDDKIMRKIEARRAAQRALGVAVTARIRAEKAERHAKEKLRLAQLAEDTVRLEASFQSTHTIAISPQKS